MTVEEYAWTSDYEAKLDTKRATATIQFVGLRTVGRKTTSCGLPCLVWTVEPVAPDTESNHAERYVPTLRASATTYTAKSRPQLTDVFYEGMR